jgi:hypothetical protein
MNFKIFSKDKKMEEKKDFLKTQIYTECKPNEER